LRKDVQEDRTILRLEKVESLDQQRQIVAIDGSVILEAKLFKEH